MQDVIIVGGGLGGLVSSIILSKSGLNVTVIEKKSYPLHKVCGEYVSNEVRPFLTSLGLDLNELGVKNIEYFRFTSPSGRVLNTQLDLGGFGISRYKLDEALFQLSEKLGVQFILGKSVENVVFNEGVFEVQTSDNQNYISKNVIGAYGKRAKLDSTFDRPFLKKKSPYIGVKYHIKTDFPQNLIALHNFQDGYCGISAIEEDKYCLCYLSARSNLKEYGSIPEMEKRVLMQNPHLKYIFENSEFLYDKPLIINEISFAKKSPIENHIFMVGDTAGLITPLCGNGMAMSIHAAKICSELIIKQLKGEYSRGKSEAEYIINWNNAFERRLWIGRMVQKLFGDKWLSELAAIGFRMSKPALNLIIKSTHGEVITLSTD
ncbi:MAG: FAD-dependent monooxygenase [Bacteroidota bacterium]